MNQNLALDFCFDAFSSREPVPTSLENALKRDAIGLNRHRAALNLTRQQREFVEKRNASYGRPGYDLRQAMAEWVVQLSAIARQ